MQLNREKYNIILKLHTYMFHYLLVINLGIYLINLEYNIV